MADVKPIRSEADYEAALEEVEHLWGAKLGTHRGDRLDVLATLIDVYESEHYPIDPPDPIEAIKFRMEQQNLTRKDLEGILGTRTRVAEVSLGFWTLVRGIPGAILAVPFTVLAILSMAHFEALKPAALLLTDRSSFEELEEFRHTG
jgi:HTH-type transcriptional regulator/antitoxin HigA